MLLVRIIRRISPIVFLIAAIYIWYFATHAIHDLKPTKVITANSAIQLFIEPDDGKAPLLNEINQAKKEILMEIYLLSDKDILTALENARQRGVTVRVMLEGHPFGDSTINPRTKKELIEHNILVTWTNPGYSLTHEKSIVIDSHEVFIMNQNLTTSSFSKNREYDILDRNPKDVTVVRNIFIKDWEREGYYPPSATSLVISPINSRKILTSLIKRPGKYLDLEFEEIEDPSIIDLIANVAKEGKVRVIVPPLSKLDVNSKAVNEIRSAGGAVRFLNSPYPHAKLIISDGRIAYVGSINLSTQSMDENRELGIILSNPQILGKLNHTFESDWQRSL
jgi:phosphatidylserine/phosphatidylglycerophosphate/cardiolipin synthase-like enzyme